MVTLPSRVPGLASLATCRVTLNSPGRSVGTRAAVTPATPDSTFVTENAAGVFRSFERMEMVRDAVRRADHTGDADPVLRLMLGVGDHADLLGQRADAGLLAADGDVELVLCLALAADLGHELGAFELLRLDLDPLLGRLDLDDLERLLFLGVERDALLLGVALEHVEADEAGRVGLDER